ncbi:MAG TPA: hypothetical protein ENN30_02190, partial [Candidatus Woesearchaeota archaeon]|nr:hypothetical protein [Candidatus Woesearchaeota archaeon]
MEKKADNADMEKIGFLSKKGQSSGTWDKLKKGASSTISKGKDTLAKASATGSAIKESVSDKAAIGKEMLQQRGPAISAGIGTAKSGLSAVYKLLPFGLIIIAVICIFLKQWSYVLVLLIAAGAVYFISKQGFPSGTTIIMIMGIVVACLGVGWYLNTAGILQAGAGFIPTVTDTVEEIKDASPIRRTIEFIKNPMAWTPTSGQVEITEDPRARVPNQAIQTEVKAVVSEVQIGQSAITTILTVKNIGSQHIDKVEVIVYSKSPIFITKDKYNGGGCINFDKLPTGCKAEGSNNGPPYVCEVHNVPPFTERQLIFSGGKVEIGCIEKSITTLNIACTIGNLNENCKIKANAPVYVTFNAEARTYYTATSRLSIERIRSDYGLLLMKHNILMPMPVGAIFQAGTAVQIDMSAGNQPILDTIEEVPLLIRWTRVGSGKIPDDKPSYMFIVTPKEFGECIMSMGNYYGTEGEPISLGSECFGAASENRCIVCNTG